MKLEPPRAVLEALQAEQILGPRRLNRLLAEVGLVWQLTTRLDRETLIPCAG
jgi:hypothetical protein